jgi:HEAT repeat protein
MRNVKRPLRVGLAVLFIAAMALVGRKIFYPAKVVYRGKPVGEWMEILYRGDMSGPVSDSEWASSIEAIEAIGTNAIPCALRFAGTSDSKLKRFIVKSSWPKKVSNLLGLSTDYVRWSRASVENPQIAISAFRILGGRAKPAIPALIRLLRTSDNPNSRVAAAIMLARIGSEAQEALPDLLQGFKDSNLEVRRAVEEAVGIISSIQAPGVPNDLEMAKYRSYCQHSADLMAPVVVKLLADPKVEADRLIETLTAFSFAEGSVATPGLLELLNHPDVEIRARATNALRRINPSALKRPSEPLAR